MKIPIFGRRTSSQEPQKGRANSEPLAGHDAVLAHLSKIEKEQPLARPQLAGRELFEMTCRIFRTDRGVRMEDLLAALASTGGFSCLLAALSQSSVPNGKNLVTVDCKDGHRYFYGDLPNRYLLEDKHSLLSLALGAAQGCGGTVSLEMVHQTVGHVAETVGSSEFGKPLLPPGCQIGDLPFNFVHYGWPKTLELMNLYEVHPTQRPAAIGFALQRAIEAGKSAISPTVAAQIVIECAVPMAKVDPQRIAKGPLALA